MLNLDVAVASFWQLARHWKSGDSSKLELVCEGGNLHIQLSATLGHPDHVHFPAPSPAPSPPPPPAPSTFFKRKSPSQLRRQVRRQEEALVKADKAAPNKATSNKEDIYSTSEKEVFETPEESEEDLSEVNVMLFAKKPANIFKCDQCGHTGSCKEAMTKHVKENHKEVTTKSFQCDQCEYETASDKGLKQHQRIKHRISQLDGNSSDVDSESINGVSIIYKISVSEKKNKDEIINDLTYFEPWDNFQISCFTVKEDLGIFSLEVTCERKYYQDFSVSRAGTLLESLPWPPDYTVISSQPLSYLTE